MPNNRMVNSVHLSSSVFLAELMNISKDIVWKDTYSANNNEHPDYAIETEIFMAASRGMLSFDIIYQFDRQVLLEAGMSSTAADAGIDDKYSIPVELRPLCVSIFKKRLLEKDPITGRYIKYVEYNNYYRRLMGLPDMEDTDFIYNTKYDDISMTTPIHLLPLTDRYNLEQMGYLDELLKQYPTKKYIKHLALKSIDPYIARLAERFSILYMNPSEYGNLTEDFRDLYNNCRYNVIRVYYNDVFRKDNDMYDGFLAMCVLFMTVQLMHYKYLDVDITRDFYDLESIRYIYDSYSVPFFSAIPLMYHKSIVKNINRIISYKGSTRVFFDLFELFNYGNLVVYEYYILKTHKFDHQNNPIFIYKEDGTLDTKAMYEIKFGKVRLYDDPPLELSNTANHLTYESMTLMDPYWISDPELLDKLYEENYNYLETKYIGIQTIFDMMKIVYEATYFIQMIINNRATLSRATLFYNNTNSYINIFDMMIYLSALVCAKYGYEGNISSELPVVSKILGFNFKELLYTIQNVIQKDDYLKSDTELNRLLLGMNVNNINSVNSTFKKITDLQKHFTDKITSSSSREEYFAYYNLEKILMHSEVIDTAYRKKDGTVAESFKDLLNDINTELYIRFLAPDLDIDTEIDIVLMLFKKTITELKYFESVDGIDIGNLIQHLYTVLEFFKSAKSELTGYNITYIISSRGLNSIKFFAEIDKVIEGKMELDDRFEFVVDLIDNIKQSISMRDRLVNLQDLFLNDGTIVRVHDEIRILEDEIRGGLEIVKMESEHVNLVDIISHIMINDFMQSSLVLDDKGKITLIHEKIHYENNITKIKDNFEFIEDFCKNYLEIYDHPIKSSISKLKTDLIRFYDNLHMNDNVIYTDIYRMLLDSFMTKSESTLSDRLLSKRREDINKTRLSLSSDICRINEDGTIVSNISPFDNISFSTHNNKCNDVMTFSDSLLLLSEKFIND